MTSLKSRLDKVERDISVIKILLIAGFIGGSGFSEIAKKLVGSPLWLDVLASVIGYTIVLMAAWIILRLGHGRIRK